jgi:UDP-N-acetylmuramoylalanine--D-glutamate ligase
VLLGADREVIRQSLARHAPDVPVVEAARTDTGAMDLVVTSAARLAVPGDTVLLSPAAQSFDMFRNYPARGDAFAEAVTRLADSPKGRGGAWTEERGSLRPSDEGRQRAKAPRRRKGRQ